MKGEHMGISWRDAATTVLAAGVITVAVAVVQKWSAPVINNPRLASVLILVVGVGMCILSGYDPNKLGGTYTTIMSSLAGLAALAAILGTIFGLNMFVVVAACTVGAMWLISTVRHLIA